MCNTHIGTFCQQYRDWFERLTQEPYCLKIKEDGNYVMFSYDQIKSDFNNPIVREARGIIFIRDKWGTPVCWAFDKFGNYGESYVPDIDWSTAFVTEKIDGSLIKIWWDWNGGWHISTNGTIDAFKAPIADIKVSDFGDYFCMALKKYYSSFEDFVENLEFDYTYMFELVGPYNRVVVPYDEPDLYFLGARNKHTGEEFSCDPLIAGAFGLGRFKTPAHFSLSSLNDCIKAVELKSWDDEGFVVADAQFNRIKIKSPAYVMAHFMRNNNVVTRKHIIRIILMNEVEEFLCYASDYKEELIKTQKLMKAYLKVGNQLAAACRTTATILHRGDYARLVQGFPTIYQGLLYMNYNKDVSAEEYTSKWNENKWEEYLIEVERLNKKILEV